MPDDIALENVVVHGFVFLDEDSEIILDILNSVKGLDLPEEFDSQVVNISEDSPEESALIFSDGLPQDPVIEKGSIELIAISVDGDDDLSLSVDLSPSHYEVIGELFDSILPHSDIHVTDFDVDYTVEEEFSDLSFSIDGPEDFDYKGVKFTSSESSFIVQSTTGADWKKGSTQLISEKSVDEEEISEETMTAISAQSTEHFDVSEGDEIIDQRRQEIEETIESFLP